MNRGCLTQYRLVLTSFCGAKQHEIYLYRANQAFLSARSAACGECPSRLKQVPYSAGLWGLLLVATISADSYSQSSLISFERREKLYSCSYAGCRASLACYGTNERWAQLERFNQTSIDLAVEFTRRVSSSESC